MHNCLVESKVADVRPSEMSPSITRRRRECLQCHRRFTTYEFEVTRKTSGQMQRDMFPSFVTESLGRIL